MTRAAAFIAVLILVYDVALLLGAPWQPYPQALTRADSAPRSHFLVIAYSIGALLWAAVALAFLGRGGEGPLRRAPRPLVAGICWYAVLSSAWSVVSSLWMVATAWSLAVVGIQAGLVVVGAIALLQTRPDAPMGGRPVRP